MDLFYVCAGVICSCFGEGNDFEGAGIEYWLRIGFLLSSEVGRLHTRSYPVVSLNTIAV